MRLTNAMLELIYRALLKFDTLTEKSEEEEQLVAKCLVWTEDEIDKRKERQSRST